MNKYLLILIIIFIPVLVLGEGVRVPESLSDVQEEGKNFLSSLSLTIRQTGKEIISFFKKTWNFFKNLFNQYIWEKIKGFLKRQIDTRKEVVEEEIEIKKEEGRDIFQKFRDKLFFREN